MKIEFYMPESLKDISLRQYQKWLKLTDGKEIDLFLQQKMVEIFSNSGPKKFSNHRL